jgi:MFS family permease
LNIHNKQPSIHDYSHDTLLLLSVSYLTAISFYGMQMLLRSLYLLRLGFDTAYLGSYLAAGALGYMVMGIPSGILGNRFGTMAMMRIGGIICLVGMVLLPLTELVSPPFRAAFPFISQLVQISGWSMLNVNLVPALMGTTSSDNRNSSYALASGLREFGSFVGSLFGGFLPGFFSLLRGTSIDTSSPYNSSIWISNGLWFIALVPLFLIKGRGIPTQQHQTQEQGAFPIFLIALLFIYVYLQQVGWAGCQSFCNPYMDQELHYSTANMGIIAAFG